MQLEINSVQEVNKRLNAQINNEADSYKILQRQLSEMEYSNNLLKHQVYYLFRRNYGAVVMVLQMCRYQSIILPF